MTMQNDNLYHNVPDKEYFKIGEVSKIAGLPTSVLRFWETEFVNIEPKRTCSGQRLYRKKDVELILTVKQLLYEKKFTIRGAKQFLGINSDNNKKDCTNSLLIDIRHELEIMRDLLS